MKIIYNQNPLASVVELTEVDKLALRKALLAEELQNVLWDVCDGGVTMSFDNAILAAENEVDHVYPYYERALTEEWHCGDCIKICCSCSKCYAEYCLGINTLEGIREPHNLQKAFGRDRTTLYEAIKYLKDNPVKAASEDHLPWVESWQKAQDQTIEDLIKYKEKHFSELT